MNESKAVGKNFEARYASALKLFSIAIACDNRFEKHTKKNQIEDAGNDIFRYTQTSLIVETSIVKKYFVHKQQMGVFVNLGAFG